MRIGLIDADLQWRSHAPGRSYGKTKADVYPNLALMKLSSWHKSHGDDVEWYNAFGERYDRVYISKVFSDTPESNEYINADEVVRGGSGYNITLVNGKEEWHINPSCSQHLDDEVEHSCPDYSLYPMVKDTAFGFLSRGCPRGCSFCHVAAKEGRKSYKVADLHEWWTGQKHITVMDPNILACPDWRDLLTQLAESKAKIDINQGLDARLITKEKMEYLNKLKLSTVHFAWDDYKQKDAVLRGLRIFSEMYRKKLEKSHEVQVFVLVNYDTTFEQDLERIYTLRDLHYSPYIMVYDKSHCDPKYKSLQRYVNARNIFFTIKSFDEYDRKKS